MFSPYDWARFGAPVFFTVEKGLRAGRGMLGETLRWEQEFVAGGTPAVRSMDGLVGLAIFTVGKIAEHDGVRRALKLLFDFGDLQWGVVAQRLAEFLTHF